MPRRLSLAGRSHCAASWLAGMLLAPDSGAPLAGRSGRRPGGGAGPCAGMGPFALDERRSACTSPRSGRTRALLRSPALRRDCAFGWWAGSGIACLARRAGDVTCVAATQAARGDAALRGGKGGGGGSGGGCARIRPVGCQPRRRSVGTRAQRGQERHRAGGTSGGGSCGVELRVTRTAPRAHGALRPPARPIAGCWSRAFGRGSVC